MVADEETGTVRRRDIVHPGNVELHSHMFEGVEHVEAACRPVPGVITATLRTPAGTRDDRDEPCIKGSEGDRRDGAAPLF
ncbi:MAG: hypothetical protein MZV70_01165 [Desulfobacterales bacterium]|nr:hypothetical protein [Desulfobacterales bacterium]